MDLAWSSWIKQWNEIESSELLNIKSKNNEFNILVSFQIVERTEAAKNE